MCAPDIPEPDPAIGEAAKSNSDVAKRQIELAENQLAWAKERAAKQDPLIEKIINQQIATGDVNSARADEQWKIYKDLFQPVEAQTVKDAMEFDSPERKARMAAEAGADVGRAYTAAQDQNLRTMGAMGINPGSGRYAGLSRETGLGLAKDTAGAMNTARRNTEMTGIALRSGAAQFGRGMSQTGIAADSLALNAGNNAVGNIGAGNQTYNQNQAAAQQWFGGAVNANNSAGQLGLGLYQGALQGAQMQGDAMAGIGQLIGSLGSAGILGASTFAA